MNILFSGGGMKLSYQVGQAHALIESGVRPTTMYCVSSGIVVAALMAYAMRGGGSLRTHYENLLTGHAVHGLLPKLPQCRYLIADYLAQECLSRCAAAPPIIALGAQRSSYEPLLIDLRVSHRTEILEALMSIPLVADSTASRTLRIIDGGFEHNTPRHLMPVGMPSLVLSHFAPKASHPSRYGRMPHASSLSGGMARHSYRMLWAWVNTSFPHASGSHLGEWIYPRRRSRLHFFSRSLTQHLEAVRLGVDETMAWMASGGPQLSAPSAFDLESS